MVTRTTTRRIEGVDPSVYRHKMKQALHQVAHELAEGPVEISGSNPGFKSELRVRRHRGLSYGRIA